MLILTNSIICIAVYDTTPWFFSLVCCRQQIKNSAVYRGLNYFEILLKSCADIGFRCSHDSVWTPGSVRVIFFHLSNWEPRVIWLQLTWNKVMNQQMIKHWSHILRNQCWHVSDFRKSRMLRNSHNKKEHNSQLFHPILVPTLLSSSWKWKC